MTERYPGPSDKVTIVLAAAVGLFLLALAVAFGELAADTILSAVVGPVIVLGVVFFTKYWLRPRFLHMLERWTGESPGNQATGGKRPLATPTSLAGVEPERRAHPLWFKNVRLRIVGGLLLPILVCTAVGGLLGDIVLGLGAGVLLGLATALVWTLMWLLRREELGGGGFRW